MPGLTLTDVVSGVVVRGVVRLGRRVMLTVRGGLLVDGPAVAVPTLPVGDIGGFAVCGESSRGSDFTFNRVTREPLTIA